MTATFDSNPAPSSPPLAPNAWRPAGFPSSPPLNVQPTPTPTPTPKRSGLRAGIAGGVVGALVAGGVAFGTVKLTDRAPVTTAVSAPVSSTSVLVSSTKGTATPGSLAAGAGLDIHRLIDQVGPSVVSIEVGVQTAGGSFRQMAAGSGVVISSDGLVLTNAHVVDATDQRGRQLANVVIKVKLADGTERAASVLGATAAQDIALLRVADASGLKAANLGSSGDLRVGDDVVAIGNALDLGDTPTVTRGIVSAKDRTLDVDANTTLSGLIQTDAAINPGNSGGALVNSAGEVVGINSAGIPDAQNVGFAIAIDKIKPIIEQIKAGKTGAGGTTGTAVAFLGVSTKDTANGLTVTGVTAGSGAANAGLSTGDVITGVNGKDVSASSDLGTVLRALKPGDSVRIDVIRNGATRTVTAQLGSRTQ